MTEQISNADYVAIVASPAYRERAGVEPDPNEGRGVQFEASLIRDLYYANQKFGRERFVSVVLPGRSPEELPLWLGPASRTYFRVTDFTPEGAESLLRHFTGQHHLVPPLGEVPKFDTSFASFAPMVSLGAPEGDPSRPSAGRSRVPTSPSRLPATEELWKSIMDVDECFRSQVSDRNADSKCQEHLVFLRQLRLRLRTHLSGRTLLIIDDYVDTLLEVQGEHEQSNTDEAIESRVETISHESTISAVTAASTRLDLLRDLLARQVAELRDRAMYESANAIKSGSSTEFDLPTPHVSDELGEMVAQSLLVAVPDGRIRVCPIEGFDYSVESATAGLMYLRIRPEVLNIDLLTVPKQRPDIPISVRIPPLLTVMDVAGDGVVLGVWHFTRRLRWNYRWRGLPTQSMIQLAVSRIKQRVLSLQV